MYFYIAVFLDIEVQKLKVFVGLYCYNISNIEYCGGWVCLAMSYRAAGARWMRAGAGRGVGACSCPAAAVRGLCMQFDEAKAVFCL